MKQTPKRKRLLAFLPAALIVGVVAGTAAGISIIPSATAANVEVTGSVDASINVGAGTPTAGQTGAGGSCNSVAPTGGAAASFAITSGWETTATVTGACSITFGASNGQIQLTYRNANTDNSGYFYCNQPGGGARSCAAGVDRVSQVAPNTSIGTDEFGIAVRSTMSNAVPGTGFVGDDAPLATDPIWRPIPDNSAPAEQLCLTSAAGDGSCDFHFGVQGKGAAPLQNNGNYSGRLELTAAQL